MPEYLPLGPADIAVAASIFKPGQEAHSASLAAVYTAQVLGLTPDAQEAVVTLWASWQGSWLELLEAATVMTDDER